MVEDISENAQRLRLYYKYLINVRKHDFFLVKHLNNLHFIVDSIAFCYLTYMFCD